MDAIAGVTISVGIVEDLGQLEPLAQENEKALIGLRRQSWTIDRTHLSASLVAKETARAVAEQGDQRVDQQWEGRLEVDAVGCVASDHGLSS